MTIQQTLTIPKATRHLKVDLSQPVPAGTVDVILSFPGQTADAPSQYVPKTPAAERTYKSLLDMAGSCEGEDTMVRHPHDDWCSLYGFCKDSGDTLDAFMERHHKDGRLELENEERERRERP
ncbi:hypothetical protein FACS1894124_8480 [Spirochaetia bacterium]|nr:hypothetical protein FACS1894124_8480 [Spirochaetia bacterium]